MHRKPCRRVVLAARLHKYMEMLSPAGSLVAPLKGRQCAQIRDRNALSEVIIDDLTVLCLEQLRNV
jgi:hypothetical protein